MLHWSEFFHYRANHPFKGLKMFLKSFTVHGFYNRSRGNRFLAIHIYVQRFYDPRYSGDWPLAAETSFGGYAVYNFVGLSLCSLSRKLYENGTKVQYCNCLMGLHFQFCRYLARAVVLQFGNINIYTVHIYYPPT